MKDFSCLEGRLLLAMPNMTDPRFKRAVIYVCSHSKEGAMGLVINESMPEIDFSELLEQLGIDVVEPVSDIQIHHGGPVESGRGFVLHSADYAQDSTMVISQTLALTATVDILRAIAQGHGPKNRILALGYAGWGAQQLEFEIQENAWLVVNADEEVVFNTELEDKWPRALGMLGVDASMLSTEAGHA